MPRLLVPVLSCLVVGVAALPVSSQPPPEPKAIVEKAIKAHGGEDKLARSWTSMTRYKGTLEVGGMTLEIVGTNINQLPGQMKHEMQFTVMGNNISFLQVYNKGKGWLKLQDKVMDLDKDKLQGLKDGAHEAEILTLVPLLRDDRFKLMGLGEDKVNGQAVLGILVSAKDHKDVNLYFSKETGMLLKRSGRGPHATTMQEVSQDLFFSDYKESDGVKYASKILFNQDDKKFLELEVTEYKILDKLDDSEFAKP